MFRTHLAFALLIGLVTMSLFNFNKYLFIIIVLFAGILPDIDHPRSKIGRKLRALSVPIKFLFGHRGLFHSLFMAAILSLFIWFFFDRWWIPFFIGYSSHLIIDGFTKLGVNFIHPFNQLHLSGFIETNGFIEKILFYTLVGCNVLIIIKNINLF